MTPLGSYWADPELGSRLHELAREKDVARVAVLAKQYSEEALKPPLNDGRALQVTIDVERVRIPPGLVATNWRCRLRRRQAK
jgi:phage gp46-like protein